MSGAAVAAPGAPRGARAAFPAGGSAFRAPPCRWPCGDGGPACDAPRSSPARGFTLLEVLIAILLLGLALTALVRLAGLEADAHVRLRDATFAQWVAADALAETRLRDPFPALGRREGESRMADRRFRWRIDVQATDEPSIRRLDVAVAEVQDGAALDDEQAGIVLTGFAVQR